jgi:DNA invertase Pin-like site-specific DNA recombinase
MTSTLVPVDQYLRMSTDRQEYSMDNQAAAIREYAVAAHQWARSL